MGAAPAIGERSARGDAGGGKSLDHPRNHRIFTPVEMSGAGRVDDQSIRRIRRDDRRIALQRPDRQAFERLRVGLRLRVHDDEVGHQRLRLGRHHA